MLHETEPAKQRALMLGYYERVLDEEAHYIHSFWWNRASAAALLRPWLEDRPEPLLQPGFGDDLAQRSRMRRV